MLFWVVGGSLVVDATRSEAAGDSGVVGLVDAAGALLSSVSFSSGSFSSVSFSSVSFLLESFESPEAAAAGAPSRAIVAVGVPWGNGKNKLSSFLLQQTLLTSRFWSQQYWLPWLEHCWTAWAPKSDLSVQLIRKDARREGSVGCSLLVQKPGQADDCQDLSVQV